MPEHLAQTRQLSDQTFQPETWNLKPETLSALSPQSSALSPTLPIPSEYSERRRLQHEVEILGFPLSRHPLELYGHVLQSLNCVPARDMRQYVGRKVRMAGWLITEKIVQTKDGDPMEFVSFEDTTGLYDATFFPEAYRRYGYVLSVNRPYVLEGLIEEEFGALTLTVCTAQILDPRQAAG